MPDPNSGVREDIDVKGKDLTPAMTPAMEWALSFRMQPAEDVYVIKNTDPLTLDPSQPLKNGERINPADQVSSKLGIDATKKHPFPPLAVPPKEHLEKVDAQWERYGIRPVDGNSIKP